MSCKVGRVGFVLLVVREAGVLSPIVVFMVLRLNPRRANARSVCRQFFFRWVEIIFSLLGSKSSHTNDGVRLLSDHGKAKQWRGFQPSAANLFSCDVLHRRAR